ncbi:MAG TPA: MBL fold metallo-hydrolase [Chloroflexota bacterium]|nr:MBL fold metallo-hydrolase [Chloroflexota bacterium]
MPGCSFESLLCGPLGNNVYVVYSEETKDALVIDPALESADRIDAVLTKRGLALTTVVATHRHFDHVAEAARVLERHGAAMLAHERDAPALSEPIRSAFLPGVEFPPAPVTRQLRDGDTVTVGDASFSVLNTPGHTPGSICLYDARGGVLFSGDTLFAGSFGRYDLPGGDAVALRESLKRLAALPAETRVYPGHGAETTIGRERWLSDPPL